MALIEGSGGRITTVAAEIARDTAKDVAAKPEPVNQANLGPPAPAGRGQPAPAPISDQQADQIASDVLDAGSRRFLSDNYDVRLDAFAEAVEDLDPESAAKVYEAVLEQDSGAFNSWLSAYRIQERVDAGDISADQQAALADGFIGAYNEGAITQSDANAFLNTYGASQFAPAIHPESHQRPLDFLDAASPGAAADGFREAYVGQMFEDQLARLDGFPPDSQMLAYGITILNGSGDAGAVADLYGSLNDTDQQAVLQGLSESGIGYINSDVDDPLATVINAVAETQGSSSADAVEIARFAATAEQDLFYDYGGNGYQDPLRQRADALGNLLSSSHGEAILDEFSVHNTDIIEGSSDNRTYADQNVEQLGNLLRLTAFDTENAHQEAAMSAVTDYAGEQFDAANSGTGDAEREALGRLSVIGTAGIEAAQQAIDNRDQAEAASRAFVGFVVDVGLAAVPGGLSGFAAKQAVANLFGSQSDAVTRALEGVTGAIFRPGTTQLTDAAKDAIANELGSGTDGIIGLQQASNLLKNVVVDGLADGTNQSVVENRIDSLAGDLQ